jgi:hypothetical protein
VVDTLDHRKSPPITSQGQREDRLQLMASRQLQVVITVGFAAVAGTTVTSAEAGKLSRPNQECGSLWGDQPTPGDSRFGITVAILGGAVGN